MEVKIGDKIRFIPAAFIHAKDETPDSYVPVKRVTGRVIYINRAHRYFRVQFTANNTVLHECFKF